MPVLLVLVIDLLLYILCALSGVDSAVNCETASKAKGFTTEVTAVGLLFSVDPAVNCETANPAKGFTTEVTAVGLLSSVDSAVNC